MRKINKIICEICGKEISKSNISKHLRRHEKHPETFRTPHYIAHDGLICNFCGKICKNKNSLIQHEIRCKNNPNKISVSDIVRKNIRKNNIVRKNKGFSGHKKSAESISKQVQTYKKNRSEGKHKDTSGRTLPEDIKEKIRVAMNKNIISGKITPINHSKAKHGYYQGIWCDSSWELAYLIYCKENNVKIKRNTVGFKYIYKNNDHLYFPDFYLPDYDVYVEIKGYMTDKDVEKHKQFPKKLCVLMKKDLADIFEFVINRHGKDYIKLYDLK